MKSINTDLKNQKDMVYFGIVFDRKWNQLWQLL